MCEKNCYPEGDTTTTREKKTKATSAKKQQMQKEASSSVDQREDSALLWEKGFSKALGYRKKCIAWSTCVCLLEQN